MFTIIISEKGGAERREAFDKGEISVGRVQGNDLTLPKGNVSKHHARLLYRDGRFIVTDLKSTNGTYVNGRKIAQATIVREGDKIYIGDFVLRLDTGGAGAPTNDPDAYAGEEPPPRMLGRPDHRPVGLLGAAAPQSRPPAAVAAIPIGPARGGPAHDQEAYPPEEEEERSPPVERVTPLGRMPGPPRVPAVTPPMAPPPSPASQALGGNAPIAARGGTMLLNNQASPPARAPVAPPPSTAQQGGGFQARPQPPPAAGPASAPKASAPEVVATGERKPSLSRIPPRETPAQAAKRLALITLVDRIAEVVDLRPLKESPAVDDSLARAIEDAARDQAHAMRDEGEAPSGVDLDALAHDAIREFSGLGPVGSLLEDEDVSEIHCLRPDQIVVKRSSGVTFADTSFTSDEAMVRIIARLAYHAGDPWRHDEAILLRRLRGAKVTAIVPPTTTTPVLVIQKPRRAETTFEELVRANMLSRPMGVFLEHCVTARARLLVTGAAAGTGRLVAALGNSGPTGDRIAVLQDEDDIALPQAQTVVFTLPDRGAGGAAAVRAAANLPIDRLLVASMAGAMVGAVLETVGGGADGVVAAMPSASLRQGLGRLVTQLLLARPGLTADGAREYVAECFDVGIEVSRLPDGRYRISRVAELAGCDAKGIISREIFTASDSPSPDGAFLATGVVPRLATEANARGLKVDANLFKKAPGR